MTIHPVERDMPVKVSLLKSVGAPVQAGSIEHALLRAVVQLDTPTTDELISVTELTREQVLAGLRRLRSKDLITTEGSHHDSTPLGERVSDATVRTSTDRPDTLFAPN